MMESQERVENFKREIEDMRLRDPATSRDRMGLRAGVVLMVAAAVVEVLAYYNSYNGNPAEQIDSVVLAVLGAVVGIIGAALFVRFSIAQFLRFWLARVTYEQQAQTDRIVEAVKR